MRFEADMRFVSGRSMQRWLEIGRKIGISIPSLFWVHGNGCRVKTRKNFGVLSCCSLQLKMIKVRETRRTVRNQYTERYRSGHNGADSKSASEKLALDLKKPVFSRTSSFINRKKFEFLSCFSLLLFLEILDAG